MTANAGSDAHPSSPCRRACGDPWDPGLAAAMARHAFEYPLYPTEQASAAEAAETLKTAAEIIDAAAKLLPNLGFF